MGALQIRVLPYGESVSCKPDQTLLAAIFNRAVICDTGARTVAAALAKSYWSMVTSISGALRWRFRPANAQRDGRFFAQRFLYPTAQSTRLRWSSHRRNSSPAIRHLSS